MRLQHGGIFHTSWVIEEDLSDRDTDLQKPHVAALSDLAACALACRSANTSEWRDVLPRKADEASKDYGMRWGIEPMFSDFKSRGFGITNTKLKHTDRIERLILVLTIAMIWAVSTGMQPTKHKYSQKKQRGA